MKKDEAYKRAERRVKAKIGFYYHLAAYVIVNLMLIFIWYFASGGGYQWFWWPMLGWGIGLVFHGMGVFLSKGSMKDRMIEKEMEREKKRGSGKGS